jgi:hypothetical protein
VIKKIKENKNKNKNKNMLVYHFDITEISGCD